MLSCLHDLHHISEHCNNTNKLNHISSEGQMLFFSHISSKLLFFCVILLPRSEFYTLFYSLSGVLMRKTVSVSVYISELTDIIMNI